MYLSAEAVITAINVLRAEVHPFIGITFLACKRFGLSVDDMDEVSIDSLTRAHMDKHHRIDRRSAFYFQPFRSAAWWVAEKYPSSGLQTVNTQTFSSVFMHPKRSKLWGFDGNYLRRIKDVLDEQGYSSIIPFDALAVWLYKDADIGDIDSFDALLERFCSDYLVTDDELNNLFYRGTMLAEMSTVWAFTPEPLEMTTVLRRLPPPSDAQAEGGRTITSLNLLNAGPARDMSIEFGQRLSIITGDNGLGKSFLLDFAWWAATGAWADKAAIPQLDDATTVSEVRYTLSGASGHLSTVLARFERSSFAWRRPHNAMTVEALAVFSRADGSFALADPIRSKFNHSGSPSGSLTAAEVWNGRPGLIEGLIRDWVRWQSGGDRKTFDQFSSVLKRLSPEDLGPLMPGEPMRLPGDPREIPTIRHRYGTIPVTHASAGVQRVLLLAYLIIWSWREHELASSSLGQSPLRRIMVVVDELEAHLHPKWQRIVLPALMGVGDILSSDLALQMIAATHSPMILASMETTFDPVSDALYHLYGDGPVVKLEETPFVKYGDASGWLTSPLFGLRHARSREAELAIEAAKALQLSDDPRAETVAEVSDRLRRYLPGDDKFWPRWLYFAEQNGVIM